MSHDDTELVYKAICRGLRTFAAIDAEVNEACAHSPLVPRTDVRAELKRLLTSDAISETPQGEYLPSESGPPPAAKPKSKDKQPHPMLF